MLRPNSVAGERASGVELPLQRHYRDPHLSSGCLYSILGFLPCWSWRRQTVVTVGGSGIRIQGGAKSFGYLCFFIQHIFVEDLLCMVIE